MTEHVPCLQLECTLLPRHLERMRVILIIRLCHLHPIDADPCTHRKLLAHQAELGNAVEQHVVELETEKRDMIV